METTIKAPWWTESKRVNSVDLLCLSPILMAAGRFARTGVVNSGDFEATLGFVEDYRIVVKRPAGSDLTDLYPYVPEVGAADCEAVVVHGRAYCEAAKALTIVGNLMLDCSYHPSTTGLPQLRKAEDALEVAQSKLLEKEQAAVEARQVCSMTTTQASHIKRQKKIDRTKRARDKQIDRVATALKRVDDCHDKRCDVIEKDHVNQAAAQAKVDALETMFALLPTDILEWAAVLEEHLPRETRDTPKMKRERELAAPQVSS